MKRSGCSFPVSDIAKAKSIEETFIEVEGIKSRKASINYYEKLWLQEPDFKNSRKECTHLFIGYDILISRYLLKSGGSD